MSPFERLTAPFTTAECEDSLARLLGSIRLAAIQKERWEDTLHRYLEQLTAERDRGKVQNTFENRGWSFCWSPGPADYEYPDSIIELEANLQEAKAAAVLDGTAVQKPSTAFWMVRRLTSSKGAQEAA